MESWQLCNQHLTAPDATLGIAHVKYRVYHNTTLFTLMLSVSLSLTKALAKPSF